MKLHKIYNVVVNDIIVATSTSLKEILSIFKEVKSSEPKAWIQTCYN